jgi:hypothetical protein
MHSLVPELLGAMSRSACHASSRHASQVYPGYVYLVLLVDSDCLDCACVECVAHAVRDVCHDRACVIAADGGVR